MAPPRFYSRYAALLSRRLLRFRATPLLILPA